MPLHEGILIRIIFLLEFIIVVYCCMQYYFKGDEYIGGEFSI